MEKMMFRRALLPLLLTVVACGAATSPPAPPPPAPVALPMPLATAVEVPVEPTYSNEDDAAIPISARNPAWGSRTALVTIVEFSDFQCPFCSRVEPALAAVRESYGPETVRIVWKNYPLPFHPNARPAAEAAMGVLALAGPVAFWRFHDLCFANQKDLGTDSYLQWASAAGLSDVATFRAGLESHRWADPVDADLRDVKAAGVNGTPAFFINGVFLNGAQPIDKFKEAIDAELVKAKAKVASGVARDRVYAELTRENRANAPKMDDDDDDDKEDTRTVFRIPVVGAPVRGNPHALVTIVEFSDFQCPFCSRVEATLKSVRDKYGDKVRLVWKNEPLPFHPNAEPAAEAALEVRAQLGDAAFWTMHDKLFAEQKDLSAPVLARLAGEMGASVERVRRAVSAHTHQRLIDGDLDQSEDFQASGTPHFFINGRRLVGAQPEDKFDKIIDEEIVKAQTLLGQGVKPADLYETLVRTGKGPPPPETKDLPASLPAGDPVRGSAAARVTVHEWADFQCPFCSRVQPTVDKLMKEYNGRIKLVWHDLPLPMHPNAPAAAQAAREALLQQGPTGFWAMHDLMFTDPKLLERANLEGDAQALKLDLRRFAAALDMASHTGEIDADKQAADAMGISGTPAFVVVPRGAQKGYFISGAQGFPKFRKVVDRALAEAK
jgi:protein-disulfide isomerase